MKFTAEAQLKKAGITINDSTLSVSAKNKKYIGSRSNIRQVFIDKVVDWTMIASKYRALVGDVEETLSITSSITSTDDIIPSDGLVVTEKEPLPTSETVDVEKSN